MCTFTTRQKLQLNLFDFTLRKIKMIEPEEKKIMTKKKLFLVTTQAPRCQQKEFVGVKE
jgi:hypothetical protein